MNINNMKNEFPEMPDEIRDRVNNEVMRQMKADKPAQKKVPSRKRIVRYTAAFAAAAAVLTLCVAVPNMGKRTGEGEGLSSAITSEAPVKLEKVEPKAKNSFSLSTCEYSLNGDKMSMKTVEPVDGKIKFEQAPEFGPPYTGCMFSISGENIKEVSISLDKGELYSADPVEDITVEELNKLMGNITPEEHWEEGYECAYEDFAGEKYANNIYHVKHLGSTVSEEYHSDRLYGLYATKEAISEANDIDPDDDLRAEWHHMIDTFDEANLSVDVTYEDGSSDSVTYTLLSGKIKLIPGEDGSLYENGMVRMEYEFTNGDDPYVYGILGEPEGTDELKEQRILYWTNENPEQETE